VGLKENVLIGKLIPAGTGLPRYRKLKVTPREDAEPVAESLRDPKESKEAVPSAMGPLLGVTTGVTTSRDGAADAPVQERA